jgi:glucose-6-phosphate isomerase
LKKIKRNKPKVKKVRLFVVYFGLTLIFLALTFKLSYIAIFKGKEYKSLADNQWFKTISLPAKRGNVYDSTGQVLAVSTDVYRVDADLKTLNISLDKSKIRLTDFNHELAKILKMKDATLLKILSKIDHKNIEHAPSDWSEVFSYREDLSKLSKEIAKISTEPKNIIVVGNGGSITSFDAYRHALSPAQLTDSVWTMDPSYLKKIRDKYDPKDTIVVSVSKSGNTLGQIESLLYFRDFPIVVVTNLEGGTMLEMAKKMNWAVIEHPTVGGRFSGGTSSTLVSAGLCGIDIAGIQEGMNSAYTNLKDEAYTLSKYYFDKEQSGYNEVYVTCYAEALAGFENLIVQLMHESACKDGKGQTFYFAMGPEAQHHTNQRFLGGKKNVIGTFIISKQDINDQIQVPAEVADVDYKGESLNFIDKVKYTDALQAEYLGTKGDADEKQVPNVTLEIDEVSAKTVGEFTAFWHMVAFYSSILKELILLTNRQSKEAKTSRWRLSRS